MSQKLRGLGAAASLICLGCLYPNLEMGSPAASAAGGKGGTTGKGGSPAGGGPTACTSKRATGSPTLIDDLNDNSDEILNNDGRFGYWFTYNDGTGTQIPAPFDFTGIPFAPTNGKACHSGSGFSTWGAGMGLSLNTNYGGHTMCTYDASVFHGVSFTLSGSVTSGAAMFIVKLASVTPPEYGGTCTPPSGTSVSSYCDDHFQTPIAPTTTPQVVQVQFTHLAQSSWGLLTTWDPTTILALQWVVANGSSSPAAFSDFCVDNVSFF
jgi:hypothetical protein